MEQDAETRVRARIQERKEQAVERGLVRDAWDIVIEEGRERGFSFTRDGLQVEVFPGSGVAEVSHGGRVLLSANGGMQPGGVYTYVPGVWETELHAWAEACRYAQHGRAEQTAAASWREELYERWGLTPGGLDVTGMVTEDLRTRHDSPIGVAA